jgi:hypothetical protein
MIPTIKRLILLTIIITLTISNIAYAQAPTQSVPIGPRVEDLKNKEEIINSLEQIRAIREDLTVIDIREDSTSDELSSTYSNIQTYLQQFREIESRLEQHKATYADSIPDLYFSELIISIADNYIISLKAQQILIRALQSNVDEAKKLFYSNYMARSYYYITSGDNTVANISTYFTVT